MKTRIGIIFGLVVIVILVTSCGTTTTAPAPSTSPSTSASVLGDNFVTSIAPVAQANSGIFDCPLDSTPDFNGTTIYFTAMGAHGPGVFRVAAGGGKATAVFTGSPFVNPRGLAFSPDGKSLFIADPAAGTTGELFTLSPNGGSPTPIQGSLGTAPQNLDVVSQNGQQLLYFTGKDPHSGQPAVLTLPIAGSAKPTVVLMGTPLVAPDGIVVTDSSVIYISDRAAAGPGLGKIFKIEGGTITAIINQVSTGNPAGIALSPDQSVLLISAHQLTNTRDQVLLVNLTTLQTGSIIKVVGQNSSAAGLHASAGQKSVFSWADWGHNNGTVYVIQ